MAGIGIVTIIDEASATDTYYGYTNKGQVDDSALAVWGIKKVTVDTSVTTTAWASDQFNQVWDDRSSLTYS